MWSVFLCSWEESAITSNLNLPGAAAYLAVIIPLFGYNACPSKLLACSSDRQLDDGAFLLFPFSRPLYIVFLGIQSGRHRKFLSNQKLKTTRSR